MDISLKNITPQEQIKQLTLEIREWDNAYYSGSKESSVSDAIYDINKKLLKMLEERWPQFALPDSPTKTVGKVTDDTYTGRVLVKHKTPMLSLNTQTDTSKQPIVNFLKRVRYAELCEKGHLRDVPDLFLLTSEKLQDVGMSPIGALKMLASIKEAKKKGLEYFIATIIRGFGPNRAKRVVAHYPTLHALRSATVDDLVKIDGIDESLATWMVEDLKNIYFFNKLSFVLGRADPASTFASEQIPSLFVVGYF